MSSHLALLIPFNRTAKIDLYLHQNRNLSKVRSRVEHGDRLYENCNGRLENQEQLELHGARFN